MFYQTEFVLFTVLGPYDIYFLNFSGFRSIFVICMLLSFLYTFPFPFRMHAFLTCFEHLMEHGLTV